MGQARDMKNVPHRMVQCRIRPPLGQHRAGALETVIVSC